MIWRSDMFRDKYPLAWLYHRNTSRWPHNVHGLAESVNLEAPFKEYADLPDIQLPEPDLPAVTLAAAIKQRFACRRFSTTPLTVVALATLLKNAYGIQNRMYLAELEFLERPVPSGGGLYPLELYVLALHVENVDAGIYHYAVLPHTLEQLRMTQLPKPVISDLFLMQPYVSDAAAIVIITAVLERSLWKYEDRGYRYTLFEAGHVAQNLNLVAAALELGSLNLGGFFDDDLATLLGLDLDREIPLYSVALGHPAGSDRGWLRQPAEEWLASG